MAHHLGELPMQLQDMQIGRCWVDFRWRVGNAGKISHNLGEREDVLGTDVESVLHVELIYSVI
jgi:hypothetical protein